MFGSRREVTMKVSTYPIAFLAITIFGGVIQIVLCSEFPSLRGEPVETIDLPTTTGTVMFETNVSNTKLRRDLQLFGSNTCPPSGFDAKQDFIIDLYFGRWYAQKQIPVAYQSIDEFYCVTADYTRDTNFCIFCNYAPRIDILNQARRSSVDGEQLGGASRFFRGIIRRPRNDPAKITVGFGAPFQPRSSYWVVAAGLYSDILLGIETAGLTSNDYEWAIITGGSPSLEGTNGKCKPNPGILNFLGMWMFTRDSIPPEGVITAIETYASNVLNLDTSAWFQVEHEGCVYN